MVLNGLLFSFPQNLLIEANFKTPLDGTVDNLIVKLVVLSTEYDLS